MNEPVRVPMEQAPARMRPLSTLPVFLLLRGRRAVVAGGSDAAAWKAELLVAAGAHVEVFAAAPGTVVQALAARAPEVKLVQRPPVAADFAGTAIAIIDAADDVEAERLTTLAREAGAPVNAIDRPGLCDFQFGAIVNRDPIVIGIGTDGAAPILAQAVRRRIEAVLPPALGAWAKRAKALRPLIAEKLAKGLPRRIFWERFVDAAFSGAPASRLEPLIARSAGRQGGEKAGRVSIVGAGLGSADDLTLRAVRALQSADVILHDDLVSPDVLELARREATRIAVGKRGHGASCRQEDIITLMMRCAREGQNVVRLKSGDPSIFGRAGEELEALAAAGIECRIVPGVTAALGLAAQLGVSLTHRDHAHSVRFVTGHGRNAALPEDLDWQGLADPATTLIAYMAGRTSGEFAEKLIAHGLSADMPAVAAAGLGSAAAETRRGTLSELAELVAGLDRAQPILIGIGLAFKPATRADGQTRAPCENEPSRQPSFSP